MAADQGTATQPRRGLILGLTVDFIDSADDDDLTQSIHDAERRSQVVRSSLPFQILLYLNGWYFAFFFVCEILLFVFKGETLPYASNVLAAEIILLFLMSGVEALRLYFGRKGNLTEQIMGVLICVILSVASIFGVLFYLLWQTYVLRAEIILTAIQLIFIGLELIFSIISIITFAKGAP